jgi:hypothetical protein
MTRIGPRMREVTGIARTRPGIVQQQLALAVSYYGGPSNQWGTAAVKRAYSAGLLRTGSCADAQCARPARNHYHYWATEEVTA